MARALGTGARFGALAFALSLWVGCGAGGISSAVDGGPSTSDASTDGGDSQSGVTVEFVTFNQSGQPAGGAPIDFPGEFSVSEVTIQLHHLGLIGDTAPAGDLTIDSQALEYPGMPESEVGYAAAPPGLYSRYEFDVERTYAEEPLPDGFDGERLSVRVVGKAHLQGKDRDFVYADDHEVTIDLDLDEEVSPGVPGRVQVALDLHGWFRDIDWEDLADEGEGRGPIVIGMGGGDEEAAESLRDELPAAFVILQD